MGVNSVKQGNTELAIEYYKKRLIIEQELGNKKGIADSYRYLGKTYYSMGKLDLASEYFEKSLAIAKEMGINAIVSKTYLSLGKVYMLKKMYAKAKEYGEYSLQIAQEVGSPNIIEKGSSLLKSIAIEEQDYKQAYKMYQLEVLMRDSILNKENYKATIEQHTKYEYEKKKATDSVKNAVKGKIQSAKLRAIQLENEKATLEVVSQKKQKWFLYLGLILVAIFAGVIYNRFKITQQQKGVIENQKLAVEEQKQQIEKQHLELEETHKEINDSIKYSERLQQAIFPSQEALDKYLNKHFVLFRPKDVVSGDFYWLQRVEGQTYFSVADCTGHGIPGALVSVVCSNALNRSIKEFSLTNPQAILNKTRELVIETFSQSGKDVKDGMDIVLCSHKEGEQHILFSGANNPLWIIRKTKHLTEEQVNARATLIGEEFSLIEYKSSKQPIGLYENMQDFQQSKIHLYKSDTLYLFTDGFADQFGGEKGKKYKYRPLKKLLLANNQLEMKAQKDSIDQAFKTWKGALEQVDDICIVGIKI